MLREPGWTIWVSNPDSSKRLFFSSKCPTGSGAHPSSPSGYQGFSPRWLKQPGCEADHTLPCSAKCDNAWNYICIPHSPFPLVPQWLELAQIYFTFSVCSNKNPALVSSLRYSTAHLNDNLLEVPK